MITKFSLDEKNALIQSDEIQKAIWIDVVKPTSKERQFFTVDLNILLPLHHEVHQIEYSNRFYIEDGAIYFSLSVVTKASPVPEAHVITFVLTQTQLITLRFSDPNPIQHFIEHLQKHQIIVQNHIELFFLILNRLLGTNADVFELVDEQSDELSLILIGATNHERKKQHTKKLNSTLRKINYLLNLLSKGYQSLTNLKLALSYYHETGQQVLKELTDVTHWEIALNQDIKNMMKQGDYLTQKLNFELQSTLGLINIEQTQIIKIFTVLAMVFMPPTLVASLYGMNFRHMPELSSIYGYPIAIVMMFVTAIVPYLFFKRKGWI